jgi:hypothetical protein
VTIEMVCQKSPFAIERHGQVLVNPEDICALADVQNVGKGSTLDHVQCLSAGKLPVEFDLAFKPAFRMKRSANN